MLPSPRMLAQLIAGSRVVSYKTVAVSELDFVLEQCILDADGRVKRPLLTLPKLFALEAAATSGTRNLYLRRKVYTDTVLLLLADSLGRVLRQPRQFMPRLGSEWYVRPVLFGLPGGRGFILTYPSGKARHPVLNIARLSPDLTTRCQQKLLNREFTSVKQILASDAHVWVTLAQSLANTSQPQVWTCRLTTGEVEGNTLFLLTPRGRQIQRLTLTWPAPGRPRYYWKSAYVHPDGRYQFIGETYRARYADGAGHCPQLHHRGLDAETRRHPARSSARTTSVARAPQVLFLFRYLYLTYSPNPAS